MSAEIFGREAELAEISAFMAGLRQSAAALVLAGPPGSGKTTLLRAAVTFAHEQGYTVLLTTPVRSEMRLAFAGLTDLLDGRPSTVIDELPPPQARTLRVALLAEEPPARPPDQRVIAVAFRGAIQALAADAPVLLVIDDVQWLDQPSETAVGFAARRLQNENVGLVCAQRTDRPGAELPLELSRARVTPRLIPVGPLSIGALHRMLRTRLDTSFSQPMLRRIEEGSACNPFIALELGRALARRGVTSAGLAALPVPDTLSGLINEHLRDLPRPVAEAVEVVAVMPDARHEQYLAAGAGAEGLDAAVTIGVLEHDGGRVRFAHPLFAGAVAARIAPARLRALHAAAAEVVQMPEARARHRALAAAGPSASVAVDLETAGQAAAARGAPSNAAELFELAASLTPGDEPADVTRRRLEMARQLSIGGEIQAARATLGTLIEATPAGSARAEALSLLALYEDDFSAATELLEQALAEADGDPPLTVDIRLRLTEAWMLRGDQERAREQARRSIADADRSRDSALLACSLALAFETDIMCGREVDERELARALELELSVGSGSTLHISPTQVAGVFYFIQGRLPQAESYQRRLLARAEADGNERWRADALLRLSRIAGRRGDLHMAAELAADALEIAEQLDLPRPVVSCLYGCASAALLLGQETRVAELARRGRDLAERTGDRPYVIFHEGLLGSLDLARADYQAAAARLGPLARTLPEIGWHPTTQTLAPDIAEALIASGDLTGADAFLTMLRRSMPDPLTEALATHCLGQLAAARGELVAAVTVLTDALAMHDRISPHPLERARVLLSLGGVQLHLHQRAAARATLSEALAGFESVGTPLWAARARAELARISGRPPGSAALTATEQRVAELVASGRSNKEVAAELFVTVRAVESNLTKAYAKLGVRSRTELAAFLHANADGYVGGRPQDGSG